MQQLDMTNNMNSENDLEGSVIVKAEPKTKKPPMYKVLLLNDDFTPMEFVVHVLEKYFKIGREAAIGIMLDVHQKGLAIVGIYSSEIAEMKVGQVMEEARKNQHPLQCTMEKE
jgi:ATP-dependent Clp protease adaptor protein ClpS